MSEDTTPGAARQAATGASQDFSGTYQRDAEETSDSQTAWQVNRKRTYDVHQTLDLPVFVQAQRYFEASAAQTQKELAAINNLTVQALQNAIAFTNKVNTDSADNVASTRAQVLKHADVAADCLWTDQLNPVTRGAGNDLTGQAPVNAALSSTASLNTVFDNLTQQVGLMVSAIVGLANSQAAQNLAIAQMLQNSKQTPAPAV